MVLYSTDLNLVVAGFLRAPLTGRGLNQTEG
jgi:hypothetical protein